MDILRYNFFIKKKFMKKNLVILGPRNTKWPKLKKYDIYGKKFKSSTNLYFQSQVHTLYNFRTFFNFRKKKLRK